MPPECAIQRFDSNQIFSSKWPETKLTQQKDCFLCIWSINLLNISNIAIIQWWSLLQAFIRWRLIL